MKRLYKVVMMALVVLVLVLQALTLVELGAQRARQDELSRQVRWFWNYVVCNLPKKYDLNSGGN